jgi:hypothetical protein
MITGKMFTQSRLHVLEKKIPMNVIELCRYFKKIQPEKRALKINLSKL